MAKSTTSFETYIKKKNSIEKQSYAKRNKWKSGISYVSSWFFNLISFVLSFIFIKSIIDVSFVELTSNSILYYSSIIVIGLVLISYELLKRFNVDHFCEDYYDHDTNRFSLYFIKYFIYTLAIVIPSIYMSINGSIKIADNFFEVQKISEKNLTIKTDSIATFYFSNYIQPLQNENALLQQQKNEFIIQKKTYLIKANDNQINKNKENISAYENERNVKIKELETKNNTILSKQKKDVDKNILVFTFISLFIEVVIVIGVWYKRLYDIRLVRDYEEIDMNSQEYKKWKKFTEILNFIYSNSSAKVGGEVETTQTLVDLIALNNLSISKKDLDDCFKLMNFLHISEKEGRRRVIKMDFEKASNIIKKHFNIE